MLVKPRGRSQLMPLVTRPRYGLVLVAVCLVVPALWGALVEGDTGVVTVPASAAYPGGVLLDQGWRYHPGDDPSFAKPDLDDSDWEPIADPSFGNGKLPKSGWHGVGWFRLHSVMDPGLAGVPLVLRLGQPGA